MGGGGGRGGAGEREGELRSVTPVCLQSLVHWFIEKHKRERWGEGKRELRSITPVHLQSLVLLKSGERAKVSDSCSSSVVGSFENTPSFLLLFFFFFLSSHFCFAFVLGSNSE